VASGFTLSITTLAENHSALCEISLTDNFPSLAFEGLCKFREAEVFPRDASSTFHLDNAFQPNKCSGPWVITPWKALLSGHWALELSSRNALTARHLPVHEALAVVGGHVMGQNLTGTNFKGSLSMNSRERLLECLVVPRHRTLHMEQLYKSKVTW